MGTWCAVSVMTPIRRCVTRGRWPCSTAGERWAAPAREALQVYDEILRRFGDDEHPGTLSTIARTLLAKADSLRRRGRPWEADAALDDLLRRFGDSQDPAIVELVDSARREKQRAAGSTGGARQRPTRRRGRGCSNKHCG